MKIATFFVVVLAIFAAANAANLDAPVLNDAMIAKINSQNGGWTAGRNAAFEGMTLREARGMLGGLLRSNTLPQASFALGGDASNQVSARNFNAGEEWPECADLIHGIRDQGRCGSCWAFAETEVLADRTCIKTKGDFNEQLAPQDPVACDKGDFGCGGGYLDASWRYLENEGCVTEACFPYTAGSGSEGSCDIADGTCPTGEPFVKYFAKNARDCAGEQNMLKEVEKKGPLEVGFYVYEDFFAYKSGVYRHVSGGLAGGHAVKIIGFGNEDGDDYWLVNNSWGTSWGMDGVFKILRGTDECNLESMCVVGDAK